MRRAGARRRLARRPIPDPVRGIAMARSRRLAVLAQLLGSRRFASQQELGEALARTGMPVTQATLSRDLRSLGVGKRPGPDGRTAYELPSPAVESLDRERQL